MSLQDRLKDKSKHAPIKTESFRQSDLEEEKEHSTASVNSQ